MRIGQSGSSSFLLRTVFFLSIQILFYYPRTAHYHLRTFSSSSRRRPISLAGVACTFYSFLPMLYLPPPPLLCCCSTLLLFVPYHCLLYYISRIHSPSPYLTVWDGLVVEKRSGACTSLCWIPPPHRRQTTCSFVLFHFWMRLDDHLVPPSFAHSFNTRIPTYILSWPTRLSSLAFLVIYII